MARTIGRLRAFGRDQRGNVALVVALTLAPVLFGAGMGLDYAQAARRRAQLNTYADSAALMTVSPAMMAKTSAQAQTAAIAFFNAQAQTLSGAALSDPVSVSVSDGPGLVRTTTVTYSAVSANAFSGIVGRATFSIGGLSTASATAAPNIDFYLMLDSSPSMAIPATAAGIATMVNNTSKQGQGGCAFACHETNAADARALGNPNGEDNFALARHFNLTLRMDLLVQAAQDLPAYANKISQQNGAAYRMAISTFDYKVNQIQPITSNMVTVQQAAGGISMLTVYKNGWLTSSNNNNDQDTDWDGAIQDANANLPAPGNGTNNPGDSPQKTLFIVTDGVANENKGGHAMFAMGGATCAALKARNIQIAILYTIYYPLPSNNFYTQYIKPFQPSIGPTLETCASPGLFTAVDTGQDITVALQNLFDKAVTRAHLTK